MQGPNPQLWLHWGKGTETGRIAPWGITSKLPGLELGTGTYAQAFMAGQNLHGQWKHVAMETRGGWEAAAVAFIGHTGSQDDPGGPVGDWYKKKQQTCLS